MQNVKKDLIVVGLGNPGVTYRDTLHNVGFKVVERLADRLHTTLKFEGRFASRIAKGKVGETTFHLLCPETYMNLSGEAVRAYLGFLKLAPSDMIVVYDDADLPAGELRLRPFGGSGGHNGLKSIEFELQSNRWARLRVGIGRPEDPHIPLRDFVLSGIPEEKKPVFEKVFIDAAEQLERLAFHSLDAVMKDVNSQPGEVEKNTSKEDRKLE